MQRLALRLLIGSVVVSAGMGIYALLVGDFGETEGRILATTFSVSAASILAMACAAAWERGRLAALPPAGAAVAVAAFTLVIIGVWSEPGAAAYWKSTVTLLILSVVAAHASLLSLVRLAPAQQWAMRSAFVASAVLTALLLVVVWRESGGATMGRWVGVAAIVLSATTIMVPVFGRIRRIDVAGALAAAPAVAFCPRCGEALDAPSGEVTCGGCGVRFRLAFHN